MNNLSKRLDYENTWTKEYWGQILNMKDDAEYIGLRNLKWIFF